jgi:hypothetical protein
MRENAGIPVFLVSVNPSRASATPMLSDPKSNFSIGAFGVRFYTTSTLYSGHVHRRSEQGDT